ncbi:hypothetical protein BSL78_27713 [Apostichopus japonicus]|uniref:Uncharacterized protein n=1 Tax=Stichopus japonicus TaxID=307972 RepID=A0A2G8JIA2_STIJA|nr:hypothetical protein BSL78_27713 [Apostichopus japonicus]
MDPQEIPRHHFETRNSNVPLPDVNFLSPRVKKGSDLRVKNRGARANSGRKASTEKFAKLLPVVKNFVERNGYSTHQRRRSETGVSYGSTIPEIRDHVLQEVHGLDNIGLSTSRYLFTPRHSYLSTAAKYAQTVGAKVASKANNVRTESDKNHFFAARLKYRMEFMTQFHQNYVAVSFDTMNKIHIGTLAVSRYHQLQKVFPVRDMPNYPDHDFPLGNGYKVTPVGYMKLEPKTPIELCKDVDGHHHYPFPRSGPLLMRHMIQKEMPFNIQRHANNPMEILGDESSRKVDCRVVDRWWPRLEF